MRILFLTHAFNSLTQSLFVELTTRGHDVSIEFDINDTVTREAVSLFRPDLIVAPYLRRAIPEDVWRNNICLIVHPGIKGDRGPSALDWAIMNAETDWGVTVLQATGEMDAGDIWAGGHFLVREATKSSLYRREVTQGALDAVVKAIGKIEAGGLVPEPQDLSVAFRPLVKQENRAIDWARDDTATVLRKIRAADGFPGVDDVIGGNAYALFDAHPETGVKGVPGQIIGRRHHAICRATRDGAVWITHLKPARTAGERPFKRPAAMALGNELDGVPEILEPTWREIRYEEADGVGYLYFPFYNGAMSTDQCKRLEAAYREACSQDTRAIVLMGGGDFWSNGMHLGAIEGADSPAEESWRNINAIDDLCHAIITTETHLTVAAMRGNAGAGGVFLALAADRVIAAPHVVLNPHYKNMGNLYGSEYWTYLLPKRVGEAGVSRVMGRRLPIGAPEAAQMGLIDECLDGGKIRDYAKAFANAGDVPARLAAKRKSRREDEAARPLAEYRKDELERMRLNFFGFDPSYHIARYNFMRKTPASRTPLFIASHRRMGGK
ncbi:MAG: hydrogenase maturation protein [Rhodospirillales bacterium]|nr:hydrogenase maturation protein [Rhodospirillales bacterium]